MNKIEEGVICIYDDAKNLLAIVKRDDVSKKHLVYLVSEATSPDIADLITQNYKKVFKKAE